MCLANKVGHSQVCKTVRRRLITACCAGMLEGSKGVPDKVTLLDLPARVDYLQRKKALLLACTESSSTLQMSLAAQPSALATQVCSNFALRMMAQHSTGVMLQVSQKACLAATLAEISTGCYAWVAHEPLNRKTQQEKAGPEDMSYLAGPNGAVAKRPAA